MAYFPVRSSETAGNGNPLFVHPPQLSPSDHRMETSRFSAVSLVIRARSSCSAAWLPPEEDSSRSEDRSKHLPGIPFGHGSPSSTKVLDAVKCEMYSTSQ